MYDLIWIVGDCPKNIFFGLYFHVFGQFLTKKVFLGVGEEEKTRNFLVFWWFWRVWGGLAGSGGSWGSFWCCRELWGALGEGIFGSMRFFENTGIWTGGPPRTLSTQKEHRGPKGSQRLPEATKHNNLFGFPASSQCLDSARTNLTLSLFIFGNELWRYL